MANLKTRKGANLLPVRREPPKLPLQLKKLSEYAIDNQEWAQTPEMDIDNGGINKIAMLRNGRLERVEDEPTPFTIVGLQAHMRLYDNESEDGGLACVANGEQHAIDAGAPEIDAYIDEDAAGIIATLRGEPRRKDRLEDTGGACSDCARNPLSASYDAARSLDTCSLGITFAIRLKAMKGAGK